MIVNDVTERIVALWEEGLSGREIAAAIGNGLTRSAVIGRVMRRGLKRSSVHHASVNLDRPAALGHDLDNGNEVPPAQRIALVDRENTCCWPIGNPKEHDFGY